MEKQEKGGSNSTIKQLEKICLELSEENKIMREQIKIIIKALNEILKKHRNTIPSGNKQLNNRRNKS